MDTYNHCNQYYPYADKTTIACRGNVFRVGTKNKSRVGYPVDDTEYEGGLVCEGHMQSYEDLADRSAEDRGYLIVRKELVGTIGTPEGGTPANKEGEPQ